MAGFKTTKNLLSSKTEYSRFFSGFRGVDFSSDHTEVNDSRFAYAVNMYKDYRSGQGNAVETIPGFRVVLDQFAGQTIHGIHVGCGAVYVHAGRGLWLVGSVDENGSLTLLEEAVFKRDMADARTVSFPFGENLYILGGGSYLKINEAAEVKNVYDEAYIPTTYISIDPGAQYDSIAEDYGEGTEYEQRNILQPKYKMTYLANGEIYSFDVNAELPEFSVFNNIIYFPSDFDVYQYGVKLPYAITDTSGVPMVPSGYPNAVMSVTKIPGGGSRINLVNKPPKPEENTWNESTGAFDEVEGGYSYPFAFPTSHAGIEVIISDDVRTVGGVTTSGAFGMDIINNCTMATVFDNRVFLSGNPEFPQHIFWSGIPEGSKYPDPSYFGILNYSREGVSDAPVVAMLPVADTLMVIKKDSDIEGSVLFHTPTLTGEDITPKIYPSTQGLYGVGCVGPCLNFHDDPIFLSRFGVEAMGQLSARYERAIEHRSSLIDAKLINCDLKNASVAEWEGYLLVLVEGRIFMADSRQMFTHESGVNQYEWYYLEDIGVYENQFPEYAFADFPTTLNTYTDESGNTVVLVGANKVYCADAVRNNLGEIESLIGSVAYSDESEVTYYTYPDDTKVYYKRKNIFDEKGNFTLNYKNYYVEPTGAMMGGEFDPAVTLKVIGSDLFFATRGGIICKFNFDMRDKETGLFPETAYDFNGRTIFSGVATKMDNCGIPHLTKNTVKNSTVIKTRTFEHSAAKVKVRTNKKSFKQVGRIINGRATFDDLGFDSFTFSTEEKSLFSINEKEKKWVEKQHFIYSDEFRRPFAIHYLAYRYNVAGRYKE